MIPGFIRIIMCGKELSCPFFLRFSYSETGEYAPDHQPVPSLSYPGKDSRGAQVLFFSTAEKIQKINDAGLKKTGVDKEGITGEK
jgi:hypothetical protein